MSKTALLEKQVSEREEYGVCSLDFSDLLTFDIVLPLHFTDSAQVPIEWRYRFSSIQHLGNYLDHL
jgi:hypothetical protein